MVSILNLTQHEATYAQMKEGVFDLRSKDLAYLRKMLTFGSDKPPRVEDLELRAKELAEWVKGLEKRLEDVWLASDEDACRARFIMLGGSPLLHADAYGGLAQGE